jgi:hypothetical protein
MKLFLLLITLANAQTFTNAERHFSFDYDESKWEVVPEKPEEKKRGADVDQAMAQKTLVTIQRKDADDKYHARFSVVTDSITKYKGTPVEQLVEYRKHALEFLKSQRFHILTTDERKLPGVTEPAFEVTANQRDFGLTFRQVVFIHGTEAYLLTAATRTAKFDEYGKELKTVFDTFKFTK